MAQTTYRGNLSQKMFPLISEYFGPSVIVPQVDQIGTKPQNVNTEEFDTDSGIPQVYYCHNVMPLDRGMQSVGYTPRIFNIPDVNSIENIFLLQDANGDRRYFSHLGNGNNYVLPVGSNQWVKTTDLPLTAGAVTTTATVNGQTYIYFSGVGCYYYDSIFNVLTPVELTSLDVTKILGIVSAVGYMIAWSINSIAWSSTIPPATVEGPIDFTPSLATGAGSGAVEAARGKITNCQRSSLGFIIYTTANAVAAIYSGNSNYPFNLREIIGAGGVSDQTVIGTDSGLGAQYVYSTFGMQLISSSQSQNVFSEVTDFLAGEYFEDFDETLLEFISAPISGSMKKAIQTISSRYLIISYGISELTHAIVFDLTMRRFGKLKFTHVSAFEYVQLNANLTEIPRDSIGLLSKTGQIHTVDFSYSNSSGTSYGVMLFGKFKLVRSRNITLDSVTYENIRTGAIFNIYARVTLNGKNLYKTIPGALVENTPNFRKYNFRCTGDNISLLAVGQFYATSFVLNVHLNGRR